ncbi:hypothetical protein F2Q68_00035654 [Brassica cretica]|uniref:Uncharacterized protein n=1 Tax=Brassica cretica TaxID=69181 RepID=A0A8S9H5Z8_BRACR|nr:hypothetical protein F2Q68_00035654 [Brassica cretica]
MSPFHNRSERFGFNQMVLIFYLDMYFVCSIKIWIRLIRGDYCPRECARQGFAVGLTLHVSLISSINVESLLKLISDSLSVSSWTRFGLVELVGLIWTDSDKAAGLVIQDQLVNVWTDRAVGTARSYWKTVKDGYSLIRNCPRAVTDGFGAQKQLWDGYGRTDEREREIPRQVDSGRKDRESWPESGSGSQLLAAGLSGALRLRLIQTRSDRDWDTDWIEGMERGRQGLSEAVIGCMVLGCDSGGTGSGVLRMASVLSVLDGWLETKPSLLVYLGYMGMVG